MSDTSPFQSGAEPSGSEMLTPEELDEIKQRVYERLSQSVSASGSSSPTDKDPAQSEAKVVKRYLKHSDYVADCRQQILDLMEQHINLREKYGRLIMWYLGTQLLIVNVGMIFIGIGLIHFDWKVIDVFVGGTLIQIFGAVFIVMKNLYPINNRFFENMAELANQK